MVDFPKDITFLDNKIYQKIRKLRRELFDLPSAGYSSRISKIIHTKLEEAELYALYLVDSCLPCPKCQAGNCICAHPGLDEEHSLWCAHCQDCDFELGPYNSEDLAIKAWNVYVRGHQCPEKQV